MTSTVLTGDGTAGGEPFEAGRGGRVEGGPCGTHRMGGVGSGSRFDPTTGHPYHSPKRRDIPGRCVTGRGVPREQQHVLHGSHPCPLTGPRHDSRVGFDARVAAGPIPAGDAHDVIGACHARVGLASGPGETVSGREAWREPQARLVVLSFFPRRRRGPGPWVQVRATRFDIQKFDIQTFSAGTQADKVTTR